MVDKDQNDNCVECDWCDDNPEAFDIWVYIWEVWWFFSFRKELRFGWHRNYKWLLGLRCMGSMILDDIWIHICDFCKLKSCYIVDHMLGNHQRNICDCKYVSDNHAISYISNRKNRLLRRRLPFALLRICISWWPFADMNRRIHDDIFQRRHDFRKPEFCRRCLHKLVWQRCKQAKIARNLLDHHYFI